MPRVPPQAVSRIAKWLELQAFGVQAYGETKGYEALAIAGDEVRHGASHPLMTMQPETAGHRVRHAVATLFEFSPRRRACACFSVRDDPYWQPMSPSTVAGATGDTLPMNIAHVSG